MPPTSRRRPGAQSAKPSASAPESAPQAPSISFEPEKLHALQTQYLQDIQQLWSNGPSAQGNVPDKRFAALTWQENPLSAWAVALYQTNARALSAMADALQADAKTQARVRFAVEQWNAASAPSNFMLFNAEAQKRAVETQGESIAKGMQNLLHDIGKGHVSMTDESAFTVGKNVATSEGAVVYQNDYFQLIEYKPLTKQVYERPFLLVPPCINKYYILDLQPENSFIRYAVAQGHRTFVVSWRNPDTSLAQATWDDYVEHAVLQAIAVVRDLTGAPKVNALGFCVGGTLLGCALGVLAARGEDSVASATFLTSFLDFANTGVMDVFIDEAFVQYREQEMGKGGLMKGADMATTFSFLRPNDLVWNYVVGNYLKGEDPPPFDLLYWNGDSTNLPGPLYAWYLRNTYLENNLVKPNRIKVCGVPLDLGRITIPTYIYGSREDHIVPIAGAYATTQVLRGPRRFVMGASGHIAGVINPPAAKKRSHWIRADAALPPTQAEWLQGATEHAGSWWPDWSHWLARHAGKHIAAPRIYGRRGKYKAMEPAPGSYVLAKA